MNKNKDRLEFPARLFTYAKLEAKFILSPEYKNNDKYILKAWQDFIADRMGRSDPHLSMKGGLIQNGKTKRTIRKRSSSSINEKI